MNRMPNAEYRNEKQAKLTKPSVLAGGGQHPGLLEAGSSFLLWGKSIH